MCSDRLAFRHDSVPEASSRIDSSAVEERQWRIAANLNQQEGSWSDGAEGARSRPIVVEHFVTSSRSTGPPIGRALSVFCQK